LGLTKRAGKLKWFRDGKFELAGGGLEWRFAWWCCPSMSVFAAAGAGNGQAAGA